MTDWPQRPVWPPARALRLTRCSAPRSRASGRSATARWLSDQTPATDVAWSPSRTPTNRHSGWPNSCSGDRLRHRPHRGSGVTRVSSSCSSLASPQAADHHVLIGSLEKFSVLCFREDRLSAVESVNDPGTHLAARRILDRSPTATTRGVSRQRLRPAPHGPSRGGGPADRMTRPHTRAFRPCASVDWPRPRVPGNARRCQPRAARWARPG